MTTELRFVERLVQQDICGIRSVCTERVLQYRSSYFPVGAGPRTQLWDDWKDVPVESESPSGNDAAPSSAKSLANELRESVIKSMRENHHGAPRSLERGFLDSLKPLIVAIAESRADQVRLTELIRHSFSRQTS